MNETEDIYNYLEKYSIYYLSKYTVTKKKFEEIIERKAKKDLFSKKISQEEYYEYLNQIPKLTKKFLNLKIINEKFFIESKIENFIKKGFSFKKIKYYLLKYKFSDELISKEIMQLKKRENIEFVLMENYCKKKIKSTEDNLTKIEKLLKEGFNYDESKKYIESLDERKI